jgi:hypothetical protein
MIRLIDYIRYFFRRNRNVYVIRQQDCDPHGCIIVRDGTTLHIPAGLSIGTVINFINDSNTTYHVVTPLGRPFAVRKGAGCSWTHLKDDSE